MKISSLKIYDRWGDQLFEKPDLTPGEQSEGWDGMFNGEPAQVGVYVFLAELLYDDGFSETVTGSITIVR